MRSFCARGDLSEKMEIVRNKTLVGALGELFTMGATRTIVLVPSTAETFAGIPRWVQEWPDLLVVAPSRPESIAPQHLLDMVRSPGALPARIIVFSDQLVSALHANVPVHCAGGVEYVSGLEAVLHVRYAYRIGTWTQYGFVVQNPPGTMEISIRMLVQYFSDCKSLGDSWLMRDAQKFRSIRERISQARRELRFLESAVLYAFHANRVDEGAQEVIVRIGEAQKRLIEASRKYNVA